MEKNKIPERDDFLGKNAHRRTGKEEETRPERKRLEDLDDSL